MRFLIISDIHGNLAALEAVAGEPHDAVICLGDIVGYGPDPAACLRWVREHGSLVLQGNHDRSLATGEPPRCRPSFEWLAGAMAPVGRAQLTEEERRYLAELSPGTSRSLDGVVCLLAHATPSDPLYRYLGPDREAWERELSEVEGELILVGHTHLQFELVVGSKRVVNPGSVGQPKDGDPRAAYAVLDHGVLTLKRVAYEVGRTVDALVRSGAPSEAVEVLAELLRQGRIAPERAGT
jgi:predicted phosphodiesterase